MIQQLARLKETCPEWRYGQMIANAVREATGRVDCDPFYISDELLEEGLDSLIKQYGGEEVK